MKTPARLTGKEKNVAGQVDLVRLNYLTFPIIIRCYSFKFFRESKIYSSYDFIMYLVGWPKNAC